MDVTFHHEGSWYKMKEGFSTFPGTCYINVSLPNAMLPITQEDHDVSFHELGVSSLVPRSMSKSTFLRWVDRAATLEEVKQEEINRREKHVQAKS